MKSKQTSLNSHWHDCLVEAISFYHSCIDHQITIPNDQREKSEGSNVTWSRPSTAREYYKAVRGWGEETIRTARLGYAPPNDELVSHLTDQGFTPEAIRATGLVTEDLEPLWQGRFVFPYLSADNRPIYAISRALQTDNQERHPDDFLSGKYAKLAHTKEYVYAKPAPYGLHTLREAQPTLVAEGIADAISAHQSGWPCISPVGLRFGSKVFDQAVTRLRNLNISQVCVIADSERPRTDHHAGTPLEIEPVGTGIAGAYDTALQFEDEGFDVRLATIPRIGRDKIDLDEWLKENWGTVQTLYRSGVPPSQHSCSSRLERTSRQGTIREVETSTTRSRGESAIFDLAITNVTGRNVGTRGANPLRHTDSRTDYFVIEDDDRAYDFIRNVTYNARTYLLCQEGERDIHRPSGGLSNQEIFIVWQAAKERNLTPANDPIPSRALVYIAMEHDLCSEADITDGWKLPTPVYRNALNVVKQEYNLDPGREAPTSAIDKTPPLVGKKTTALGKFSTENPSSAQQRSTVDAEGERFDPLRRARERCEQSMVEAVKQEVDVLIDALPAMGKSRNVSKVVAQSNISATVLTARSDLYHEHQEWCEQEGLDHYRLPAFHQDCPTAAGEHGDEWADRVLEVYNRDVRAGTLHRSWLQHHSEPLPCTRNGPCPYQAKWDFNPEDHDVLIGHYTHAYRTDVIEGRVVVFDEAPWSSFLQEVPSQDVARSVSSHLSRYNVAPFQDFTEVLEQRGEDEATEQAKDWCLTQGLDRDTHAVLKTENTQDHALAPILLYALLTAEDLGNGWEQTTIQSVGTNDDDVIIARERGSGDVSVLIPPTLAPATCVIGLEGMAAPELWELALGRPLEHRQVLNNEERGDYLTDGLNLDLIQTTTDSVYPYSGGTWVNVERDEALLRAIRFREGTDPALISTNRAIQMYDDAGLLELVSSYEHYGNLTGSNQFEGQRVGVVVGSQHYGDPYLELWGALAGEVVERQADGNGLDVDFGPFGNSVLRHMREYQVLQAVLRYTRGVNEATVYVHTAALPSWVPVSAVGSLHKCNENTMAIVRALQMNKPEELKTDEVANQADTDLTTTRRVRQILNQLAEAGWAKKTKLGRGVQWSLLNSPVTETDCNHFGWLELDD